MKGKWKRLNLASIDMIRLDMLITLDGKYYGVAKHPFPPKSYMIGESINE